MRVTPELLSMHYLALRAVVLLLGVLVLAIPMAKRWAHRRGIYQVSA